MLSLKLSSVFHRYMIAAANAPIIAMAGRNGAIAAFIAPPIAIKDVPAPLAEAAMDVPNALIVVPKFRNVVLMLPAAFCAVPCNAVSGPVAFDVP